MTVNLADGRLGLAYAQKFTQAFKENLHKDSYTREVQCLKIQFPAALIAPRQRDLLCGKRKYPEVGHATQYGGLGYYFSWHHHSAKQYPDEQMQKWRELKEFWDTHNTTTKCLEEFSPLVHSRLSEAFTYDTNFNAGYPLYRMAGLVPDYARLVRLGISGLKQLIAGKKQATSQPQAHSFYAACEQMLILVQSCIEYYISQASLLQQTPAIEAMVSALQHILDHPPQTFHQALQLILIVQTISGTLNFGRLDVVLGPLLCRDLDKNELRWEDAKALMQNFYTIIEEEIMHYDGRIIVGGRGRENESAADVFALLAMETTDSLSLPMPQLSLRFYQGQNPELLNKAYEVIGNGKTFPILYNDDQIIPAMQKAFNVDQKKAQQYVPFGCGEYTIAPASCSTPNFILNLSLCLEFALNNGKSILDETPRAPDYGSLSEYKNFNDLWKAYDLTVRYFVEAGAQAQADIYTATAREAPFLLISLLSDDCLEKGKSLLEGGVRYLGGTNETYGNTNAADSLCAIDELVYKKNKYSQDQLLQALKANWNGFDEMRARFIDAPKFGNDNETADIFARQVHVHVCLLTSQSAAQHGLHHFLVVVINNNTNTLWGKTTAASADGRYSGAPLAPGNTASAGSDKNGISALLNSQANHDPSLDGGAVHNVKISAELPRNKPELFKALFAGYWQQGGTQSMITVINRTDLEEAMKYPEKYANLLVRVGGFSARFIDLDPATQKEILSRTLHC